MPEFDRQFSPSNSTPFFIAENPEVAPPQKSKIMLPVYCHNGKNQVTLLALFLVL
jgi:hypothetical protein